MGFSKHVIIGSAFCLAACAGEIDESDVALREGELEVAGADAALCGVGARRPAEIDVRRSLAVTDAPILERFSFERVMNQLVKQAKIPNLTAAELFNTWWDTQNSGENARFSSVPHCDDEMDPALGSTLNGFPYDCRDAPSEGAQASCNPFTDEACAYMPIGLFNRFDLASEDGASCGEYRIVYAKTSGQTDTRDRNLIIFEAALPNPAPHLGLAGCRPVVSFWAELSRIDNIRERARRLEKFYFEGLGQYPAVVDIRHFGDNAAGRGQVRTNQFMQPTSPAVWTLREFKLVKQCSEAHVEERDERGRGYDRDDRGRGRHGRGYGRHDYGYGRHDYGYGRHDRGHDHGDRGYGRHGHDARTDRTPLGEETCSLVFLPVTVKVNPYGGLFAEEPTHPKAAAFQEVFPSQVASLAADDLMGISMAIDDTFNTAQSHTNGTEMDFLLAFGEGGAFGARIQEELEKLGSDLEPIDIVARAQTQTCAGCHQLSNDADLGGGLVWPSSLGFVHVTEREPEVVNGVTRYRISDALTGTFLPHRKQIMQDFLRGRPVSVGGYASMGGRETH